VPLLNYLKSPHAGIRSRAAEVVSTVVQNNPKSQQQVLDNQGLEYLLFNFTKDKDITSRTKALGAISCMFLLQASSLSQGRDDETSTVNVLCISMVSTV